MLLKYTEPPRDFPGSTMDARFPERRCPAAWVTTIAYALQNYGDYVVDYGGSFEVKGFTDKNQGSITWASVGVPDDGYSDLAMLPWSQMQVEIMQSCN